MSIILAADLTFFIFFPTTLTDIYEQIFDVLPWSNNLEITIMLSTGLIIATTVSILLVRSITQHVFKSIRGENTND
jgi:hypothetical protein